MSRVSLACRFLTVAAIILGKEWREESEAVRKQYQEMAQYVKQELMVRFPDYQFAPRRSEEIRHRVKRSKPSCHE